MMKRIRNFVVVLAAVVMVATSATSASPGQSQDSTESREDFLAAVERSDLTVDPDSLSLGPVEENGAVPEGIFDALWDRDKVLESIDAEAWNEQRARFGLKSIDFEKLDRTELETLLGSTAISGFGYFPSEAAVVESHIEQLGALRSFHQTLVDSEGFLASVINEETFSYTAWVKGSIEGRVPDGATIVESRFSADDVGRHIDGSGVRDEIAAASMLIAAIVETSAGAQIEVYREGVTDVGLIENTVEIVRRRGVKESELGIEFDLVAVSDPQIVEVFCDDRERCSHLQGAMHFLVGSGCSTGFPMRDPNSSVLRYISTAGHCSGTPASKGLGVRGSDATNGGSDAIITGFAQPHPPVDQEDTNPRTEIDGDIQGLRPPWSGAVVSTYFRDASLGNNPLTSVSGRPSMGAEVCMSAANKVYRRCGRVDDTYTTPANGDGVGWIRVDFLECCGTEGPLGGDSGGAITYRVGATTAVAVIGNAGVATNAMTYGLRYGYFPLARDIPNQYGGISVFTQSNIWPSYQDSFIAGLYQTALQRQPAVSEVDYWANPIPNGGNCMAPSKWRVEAFLKSAELTNGLPLDSLSNATKRVRRLYWSAFNRVPDAGGLDYWADTVLSGGESTWSWLVSYFIYNVTTESNPRFTTVVNQERGPCSS